MARRIHGTILDAEGSPLKAGRLTVLTDQGSFETSFSHGAFKLEVRGKKVSCVIVKLGKRSIDVPPPDSPELAEWTLRVEPQPREAKT